MKKRHLGFTLIELMISISIVATLASLAIPSYQQYVYRAKAAEVVLVLDKVKTALAGVEANRGPLGSVVGVHTSYSGNSPDTFLYSFLKEVGKGNSSNMVIPGIDRSELDRRNSGLQMIIESGFLNVNQPGQYKVMLYWSDVTNGGPVGSPGSVTNARQIALAVRDVMEPHAYKTRIGADNVVLYLKIR